MKKIVALSMLTALVTAFSPLSAAGTHSGHDHSTCETNKVVCHPTSDTLEIDCVLEGSGKVNRKFTPPPFRQFKSTEASAKTSNFDLLMYYFPSSEAVAAFEYAVSIWEKTLHSAVPIRVLAYWSTGLSTGVLAGCSPSGYEINFYGETMENTMYPFALHKKLIYSDDENTYDLSIVINADIENWYYGTDGNTPEDSYDFVTVMLHELAHGLGFMGSGTSKGFIYNKARVYATYDRFLEDQNQNSYDTYENGSSDIQTALRNAIYFNGELATDANGGEPVKLYSPETFTTGSSIYHLDSIYNDDDENALLTHSLDMGRAIHTPGPLVMAMLKDMGWDVTDIDHDVKDIDTDGSTYELTFDVSGEYPVSADDMTVYYRKEADYGVAYSTVSASLLSDDTYTATLTGLEYGNEYRYYIETKDVKNEEERTFKYPAGGGVKPAHFIFGPDTTAPVISDVTENISVWKPFSDSFEVEATVTDNGNMESVVVSWFINGVEQSPVVMTEDEDTKNLYTAEVVLPEDITRSDSVKYCVVATDLASDPNITKSHESEEYLTVQLAEFEVLTDSYSTRFDNADSNAHFILSGMKINRPSEDFEGYSLNTPHPYVTSKNYKAVFDRIITVTNSTEISWDEIVLVEEGTDGIEYPSYYFYDYAVVEVSTDNGDTWDYLIPGYDSRESDIWLDNWNSWVEDGENLEPHSYYFASPSEYESRSIHLVNDGGLEEGDQVILRFRMYSDGYVYGWGWSIANFKVNYNAATTSSLTGAVAENDLIIAPNPVRDIFSIRQEGSYKLEIYTLTGRLVKSLDAEGYQQVDISELQNGVYMLRVIGSGKDVQVQKLIKK